MAPCKCGSTLMLHVYGKCSDLGCYSVTDGKDTLKELDGYAPHIEDVCGGDDIELVICIGCNTVQGKPLTREGVLEAFGEDDEPSPEELASRAATNDYLKRHGLDY